MAQLSMMQFSMRLVTSADFCRHRHIFRNHPGRGHGLTDCVSFALMKSLDIDEVFAFDEYFAQFGFTIHPEI